MAESHVPVTADAAYGNGTFLIGRRSELAEVTGRLTRHRLVTVSGVGGVGKTCLARKAAADLRPGFPDGVWWVELSPLEGGAMLVYAIAEALPLVHQSTRPVLEAVADYLSGRQLLLVLDTCEHLVRECAETVAALLTVAPGLRVLATSRRPLDLPAEDVVALDPLPEADARALLALRAGEAAPGCDLGDDVEAAALCRRLEGLPLAIELAAARLREMSTAELNRRLEDRFEVLGETRQTQCTRPTRPGIRRCAPRSAGATSCARPPSASPGPACPCSPGPSTRRRHAGCARTTTCPPRTCPGCSRRSCAVRSWSGCRPGPIRATGCWTPSASSACSGCAGSARSTRSAAATSSTAWTSPAPPTPPGQDPASSPGSTAQPPSMPTSAPRSTSASPRATGGARRYWGALLWCVWFARGLTTEGRYYLDRALALNQTSGHARGKALWASCLVAVGQGDIEAARRSATAFREATDGEDDETVPHAAAYLAGIVRTVGGEHTQAIAMFDTAPHRRPAGGRYGSAWGLIRSARAFSHVCLGQFDQAVDVSAELRAECARHGELWLRAYGDFTLALAELGRGRAEEAVTHARAAVRVKRDLHDSLGSAASLDVLASASLACGHAERAARLVGGADRLWQTIGSARSGSQDFAALRRTCEARVRELIGDDAYGAAFRAGYEGDLDAVVAEALTG
ncbi:NB-ARC domain-containing protein [Streptomyces sp. PmtG]